MIDCAINVLPDPVSPMRAKLSPGKNMERNPADQLFFRAVQLCGDHAIIILQDRFFQVSSESTFLHSPARKNYVRFLMKRCAIALESGGNIYNHILI